jgi:hypothetical protein
MRPTTTTRRSTRRARPQDERGPGVKVSGAVPYKPPLSPEERVAEVEKQLGERIRLAEYRSTVEPLKAEERELLIDQAQVMLEQVFVHLPLKRAMHGIDPIQRLRLLRLRHRGMEERAFQSEMADIFIQLRDLHTNYILPEAYGRKLAFLPFRVEEFYDDPPKGEDRKVRRYIVTWVSPVNAEPELRPGVVVTHWNGSPTELAVARNAAREAGSNPEARRAQGVEALTLRWLGMSLPPDEDWVTLTWTDGDQTHEARFHWEVIDVADRQQLMAGLDVGAAGDEEEAVWGIDLRTTLLQRARDVLFDPGATRAAEEMAAARLADDAAAEEAKPPIPDGGSRYPGMFPRFGSVNTPSGVFGYVRLRTFSPPTRADGKTLDIDGPVREFARILSLLPPTGLILDVRGNGGGVVTIGERLLQMITPREIVPEPFHFLATPLTLAVATRNQWYEQWRTGIEKGIETGASFSLGFPLTPPELCNDVGQVYQGPVVLITDALCYSTTDICAAGFQDHSVGKIIGVHGNTGAGGANVWSHADHLLRLELPDSPFKPLPRGARMRVAVRRSTRVGARSGVPVEDLGVVPDLPYEMTRNDVLNHNPDLIAFAASVLKPGLRHALRLERLPGAPGTLRVSGQKLDRVDVLVDGRTVATHDIAGDEAEIQLPPSVPPGAPLRANGYHKGALVACTRIA